MRVTVQNNTFEWSSTPKLAPLFWSQYEETFMPAREASDVALHVAEFIFGLLGVIFNTFTIKTLLTSPCMREKKSVHLQVSLVIGHLLIGGGVILVDSIVYFVCLHKETVIRPPLVFCNAWAFYTTFACTLSCIAVPAISLDRYFHITRPLHYDWLMTSFKMRFLIASVWLFSISIALSTLRLPFEKPPSPAFPSFRRPEFGPPPSPTDLESLRFPSKTLARVESSTTNPLNLCRMEMSPQRHVYIMVMVILVPMCLLIFLSILVLVVTRRQRRSLNHHVGTLIGIATSQLKAPEEFQWKESNDSFGFHECDVGGVGSSVDVSQPAHSASRHPPPFKLKFQGEASVTEDESVDYPGNDSVDHVRKWPPHKHYQEVMWSFSPKFEQNLDPATLAIINKDTCNSLPFPPQETMFVSTAMDPPPTPLKEAILWTSSHSFENQGASSVDPPQRFLRGIRSSFGSSIRSSLGVIKSPTTAVVTCAQKLYFFFTGKGRANKAYCVISVTVGTFIVCWLPLFSASMYTHVWPGSVKHRTGDFVLWLAYFTSSTINPLVYVLFERTLLEATLVNLMGRSWLSCQSRHSHFGRLSRTYSYGCNLPRK